MTGRPKPLADLIAIAIVEHGPSPASRLSALVRRRKADVLAELHANPAFEQAGQRRGSTWHLNGNHKHPPRNKQGTNPSGESAGDLAARVLALEQRVAELEHQLAESEMPTS